MQSRRPHLLTARGQSPRTPGSRGCQGEEEREAGKRCWRSEDSDVENCGAITKAGKRCKNKVRTPAALDIVSPVRTPSWCGSARCTRRNG